MKKTLITLVIICFMFSSFMFMSCDNQPPEDVYEVKVYDSDWNEIVYPNQHSTVTTVNYIYDGKPFTPYNAIAFCNGEEFTRIDCSFFGELYKTNPLKLVINNNVISDIADLPVKVGFYDIRYTFWYTERTLDHYPRVPGNFHINHLTILHIDTDFNYELKVFNDGVEITENEVTVKYDGTTKMFDATAYRNGEEILKYTFEDGVSSEYNYKMSFWANSYSLSDPQKNINSPNKIGQYKMIYSLYKYDKNNNIWRDFGYRKEFILKIVE